MSTFKVEERIISESKIHPNADRLSLCKVEGLAYQFVTGRDQYKIGDKVVFFPLDAELPIPLVEALGMVGKFSGAQKNRIATVRLRGEFSQGFVCPFESITVYLRKYGFSYDTSSLTEDLEVMKYDPPEVLCKGGKLIAHVSGVPYYDIEGVDRHLYIIEKLSDMPVLIMSKIEGSNHYCGITDAGVEVVGQRNGQIILTEGSAHTWWDCAKSENLLNIAKKIQNDLFTNKTVILRGELIGPGIQGNYYNLSKHKILIFDILVNGEYLSANDFIYICESYNIQTVPILSRSITLKDWLNGMNIKQASNYKSLLVEKLEEGLVIKPMVEQIDSSLKGRLIIKQRGVEYLYQSGK